MTPRHFQELNTDGRVIAEWQVDPTQAAEWAVDPAALADDCPEPPDNHPPRIGDITADSSMVEFALAYLRAGFEIMPRYGKAKLVDALTGSPRTGFLREDEIREHWDRNPRHQVAAVLGPDTGAFVVDVDQHGDVDGLASLRALEAEHGRLPPTPFVLSPTGAGRHIYFDWPCGPIRTCQIAPGVEILADRAAANLPPSHKSAGPYRWSLSRHPDWLPRAQAPEWLLELALPSPPPRLRTLSRLNVSGDRSRYVEAALTSELADYAAVAAPGHRNAPLNRAAFRLARFVGEGAITTDDLTETLVAAAVAAGHHQRDARQTVAGAIRRGSAR